MIASHSEFRESIVRNKRKNVPPMVREYRPGGCAGFSREACTPRLLLAINPKGNDQRSQRAESEYSPRWTLFGPCRYGWNVCKLLRCWSGRVDSNHRPPGPEPTFINNLRALVTENKRPARLRLGPHLDPERQFFAFWTLAGPCFPTLVIPVQRAYARGSLPPSENLTKIFCSERISKSPPKKATS